MKAGSLVVIKPYKHAMNPFSRINKCVTWFPIGDEKTIYTIREMWDSDGPTVAFEEGVLGVNTDGKEIGMDISYVREVQPPMEGVAEIVEECQLELV